MHRALPLLLLALEIGCASNAPAVKPTMQAVPPNSAVVIGRFGALSSERRDGLYYRLQALDTATNKKWDLPLSNHDLSADGNSVAFYAELPPGIYLLTNWVVATATQRFEGEGVGVAFELPPSEVTCIGAVYVGTRGDVPGTKGSTDMFRVGTVLRDECDVLTTDLKTRAPLLPTAVKRLAVGATELRPPR